MNKRTKNKGITLIALVISIIVMLILVAVSISMAVNGGLFNYAGKAVGDTKGAMTNEQFFISDWIEDIESGLNIKKVTDENPGVLEGEGTEEDPYTINSIEDLVVFSYNVTNGNTYEGKNVKLMEEKLQVLLRL